MNTTFQVIREFECGENEDYVHDRFIVFEASEPELAHDIARMECEDDRLSYSEYGYVSDMEEINVGDDKGFSFSTDDTNVWYTVHREDVYETKDEYIQYRKLRARQEHERELYQIQNIKPD